MQNRVIRTVLSLSFQLIWSHFRIIYFVECCTYVLGIVIICFQNFLFSLFNFTIRLTSTLWPIPSIVKLKSQIVCCEMHSCHSQTKGHYKDTIKDVYFDVLKFCLEINLQDFRVRAKLLKKMCYFLSLYRLANCNLALCVFSRSDLQVKSYCWGHEWNLILKISIPSTISIQRTVKL